MTGNKKLQVWLPLLFALVMIAGMFFGYKLGSKGGKNFFASNKRSSLQEAMDIIRMRYVDSVSFDSIQGRAIEEMMSELDPHSVYLPPVDLAEANEDLAGNFQGIGVEFNIFSDTVNVVYVIPNGPSDKAGLQTGDKIIKVNDSLLVKKGLSTDDVKKYIRGPGGTVARMQLLRNGKTIQAEVSRGTIPVSSIDAAYLIDKTTGYIRLDKFTSNSYKEFMKALEPMTKQGIQNLIFDLRGNGGGFMNEAVEMADEFLDGDKLVVYTQGLNSKKKEYRCKRPGLFEKGRLVLLVDELSASASEVLAGALQDWCRATIIGRRTFGKGLVQEQYPLNDGSALRLTTARYYTPLGRSIQRSYDKGKKVYMDDLWERYNSGEFFSQDSVRRHQNGKKFFNNCRDTLFAGDGITPNVFVAFDTAHSTSKMNYWISSNHLNNYLYNYYLSHRKEIDQYKSVQDFSAGVSSSALWDGFAAQMQSDSMKPASLSTADKALLQLRMKALLARYRWRNSGFYEMLNGDDAVVKKAVSILGQPL
jgi:carboxyl-terminal processing protease